MIYDFYINDLSFFKQPFQYARVIKILGIIQDIISTETDWKAFVDWITNGKFDYRWDAH